MLLGGWEHFENTNRSRGNSEEGCSALFLIIKRSTVTVAIACAMECATASMSNPQSRSVHALLRVQVCMYAWSLTSISGAVCS